MIPRPGHRPDHQFHRAHRRQQSCGTSGSYASRFGSRLHFLALSNSYLTKEIVYPLEGIPFFHRPLFFVLYALEVGNVFWPDMFRRLELVGYLLQAFYHEVVVNMAPEKAHKTVKTSRVMGEAIDANPVRDIRRYGFGLNLSLSGSVPPAPLSDRRCGLPTGSRGHRRFPSRHPPSPGGERLSSPTWWNALLGLCM